MNRTTNRGGLRLGDLAVATPQDDRCGGSRRPVPAGFPAIAQSKPDQLIIPDWAALRDAYIKAHYTFTEATGIKIVPAEYMGVAQLKAMVDNRPGAAAMSSRLGRRGGDRQQAGPGGEDDYSLTDRPKMVPQAPMTTTSCPFWRRA